LAAHGWHAAVIRMPDEAAPDPVAADVTGVSSKPGSASVEVDDGPHQQDPALCGERRNSNGQPPDPGRRIIGTIRMRTGRVRYGNIGSIAHPAPSRQ
jgi:hypothetical protein